jgi:hypothetical protein
MPSRTLPEAKGAGSGNVGPGAGEGNPPKVVSLLAVPYWKTTSSMPASEVMLTPETVYTRLFSINGD